jgi:hypothetical protein
MSLLDYIILKVLNLKFTNVVECTWPLVEQHRNAHDSTTKNQKGKGSRRFTFFAWGIDGS